MALRGQKTTSDYLEWDSLQQLIYKLERDNEHRFALLLALGSYTGLRISDLLRLRWDDVLDKEYLSLKEKKTGKDRRIDLNPQLIETVNRLYKNEPKEQLIFVNRYLDGAISTQYINRRLKDIFDFYNIKGQYSSHFMRKSLGRRVWNQNNHSEKSLIMLSKLFNHASISTTKIYLGIREEEIKNIYLNL